MGVDIDGIGEDTTVVCNDGGICVLDDGIDCIVNSDGCGGVYFCIDDDIGQPRWLSGLMRIVVSTRCDCSSIIVS